ncbi:MAG: hypothetical protein PF569_02105 [Candidatus Woesearchaeota archaeon]|nr:hypothetical protein [Candidatus Woesearchaeota archaeon]
MKSLIALNDFKMNGAYFSTIDETLNVTTLSVASTCFSTQDNTSNIVSALPSVMSVLISGSSYDTCSLVSGIIFISSNSLSILLIDSSSSYLLVNSSFIKLISTQVSAASFGAIAELYIF